MVTFAGTLGVALIVTSVLATAASAQSAEPAVPATAGLSVSLNAVSPREDGCRVTFVTKNGMAQEIDELGLEIAVFRSGGALDRLMRLNLGRQLSGRTRVSQFDLAGLSCDAIEAVMVNDVTRCSGGSLEPVECLRAIEVSTRTEVEFSR